MVAGLQGSTRRPVIRRWWAAAQGGQGIAPKYYANLSCIEVRGAEVIQGSLRPGCTEMHVDGGTTDGQPAARDGARRHAKLTSTLTLKE